MKDLLMKLEEARAEASYKWSSIHCQNNNLLLLFVQATKYMDGFLSLIPILILTKTIPSNEMLILYVGMGGVCCPFCLLQFSFFIWRIISNLPLPLHPICIILQHQEMFRHEKMWSGFGKSRCIICLFEYYGTCTSVSHNIICARLLLN